MEDESSSDPSEVIGEDDAEIPGEQNIDSEEQLAKIRITKSYARVVMDLNGLRPTVRRGRATVREFGVRVDQFDGRPQIPTQESVYTLEVKNPPTVPPYTPLPLKTISNDPDGEFPKRLAHLRPYQIVHTYDSVEGQISRGVAPVVVVPVELIPAQPSPPLPFGFFDRINQEWEEGIIKVWWFTLDFRRISLNQRRSIKLWLQIKMFVWKNRLKKIVLFIPHLIIRALRYLSI